MPPKKKAKTEATAAPTAATAAKPSAKLQPCGRTRGELDELKEKVRAGKIGYVDYFYGAPHQLPDGTQVSIDRCKECGCTIGQHAPGELLPAVSATQVVPGLYDAISGAKPTAIAGTSALDVMYSKAGWPAELSEKTCFVRKEVVTIVADFLKHPKQCIVIVGQPGTGKSFAGGYAVNRCLNADHKIVIYVVRDRIYTFDGSSKTASRCKRTADAHPDIIEQFPEAILIYDCEQGYLPPPTGKRNRTIAISSPDEDQYKNWAKQVGADTVIVDIWSDDEIDAACIAFGWDAAAVAAVKTRRTEFGPIPRHIFTDEGAQRRLRDVKAALGDLAKMADPLAVLLDRPKGKDHPSHKLMMMKKMTVIDTNDDPYMYIPCNNNILTKLLLIHGKVVQRTNDAWLQLLLHCDNGLRGSAFELLYGPLLLHPGELQKLFAGAVALLPRNAKTSCTASKLPTVGATLISHVLAKTVQVLPLNADTMYWSEEDKSFPVLDRFVMLGNDFIGLQFTESDTHRPNATAVAQLWNFLVDTFTLKELAKVNSWKVIFVRPPRATTMQEQKIGALIRSTTPPQFRPKVDLAGKSFKGIKEENEFCTSLWKMFGQYEAHPLK